MAELSDEEIAPVSTWVVLARMEGTLNLVAERVTNTARIVEQHSEDIGTLKSLTQTLREGADADKKTAVALALALKEADETRRTKSEASWSPITKVFAVLAAVGVIVTIWYSVKP
jgi:hypothetical protein